MPKRLRFTGIALIISAVLALIFISVYVVSGRSDDGTIQGRVLIWHAYTGTEAEAFLEMLERFRNIHPNVTVMQQGFPSSEVLQEEYLAAVGTGLGPDVIIGPSTWIASFAPTGQIAPVDDLMPEDVWQRYTTATIETVSYGENRYGVPQAFNTLAVYYNRNVVSNTVSTTDALEREAAQGALILMSTTFRDAYWGINAFGGQVFDEDGRIVLDRGGFANWLAWLSNLRNYPGVILDNNREALRNRFLQGDAAYYFGYASELALIIETLGVENLGVAPLPAGPIGNAQPLLETTAFMFSPVSSNNQRKLAVELSQFLSNSEQSGALMRRVRTVPANQRVRINPRLNPVVSSFATQARAGAPRSNTPEMETALRLGGEAYLRVLDGGVQPAEAAIAITQQINEANNMDIVAQPIFACTNLGTVRLIHTWEGEAADALHELIRRFRAVCPLIIVDVEYEPPQNVASRLQSNVPAIGRGFTILGSPALLQELLGNDEPLLREMSTYGSTELLQRFQPNALDTMRYQRILYGLPAYLDVDTFYYNRELIDSPALTVADLRTQSGQGAAIELDINFERAYWGITAFGGRLFDGENRVILDQGGMDSWLAWLNESRESFGIGLSTDSQALRERFEAGQIAYYVGPSSEMQGLIQSLGEEVLGVAEPPDGPGGNASTFLRSQGFFLSRAGSETQVALALEFIQFVTNAENQLFLAESAGLIPVNATVDVPDTTRMSTLLEIARNAYAPPNTLFMDTIRQRGSEFYTRVLEENESPEQVVAELSTAINEAHGISPLPTPEPTQPVEVSPVEPGDPDILFDDEDPDASESQLQIDPDDPPLPDNDADGETTVE